MAKPKKYVGMWYVSDSLNRCLNSGEMSKAELTKKVKAELRSALAPGQEGYWEIAVELGPEHYGYLAKGYIKK